MRTQMRRRGVVALASAAALLAIAGVAYATISPTVAQLSPGDTHCPAGGAAITDANGSTAYVCNGQDGQPGQNGTNGKDFSGTFTSPNGQFTLSVADSGVQITGPGEQISLDGTGLVTIKGGQLQQTVANDETITVGHDRITTVGHDETLHVFHDRTQTVDNNETVTVHGGRTETVDKNQTVTIHGGRTETVDGDENVSIGGNRTENVGKDESIMIGGGRSESVGKNDSITVGGDRSETVGGTLELQAAADLKLDAAFLGLNAGTACEPVARVGDPVNSFQILMGSPDICVD